MLIVRQEKKVKVIGQYSDGVERELSLTEVAITSKDPSIASVEAGGKIRGRTVGKTKLMVKVGAIEAEVPVEVERCTPDLTYGVTGHRPNEVHTRA